MKLKIFILLPLTLILCINFFTITVSAATTINSNEVLSLQQEIRSVLQDQRFDYPDHLAWWRWLKLKIDNFFNKFHVKQDHNYDYRWLNDLLKYLGLILLILSLIFLPKYLFSRSEKAFKKKHPQKINSLQPELLLDEKAYAIQLAAAGDYREAIRHLYLANLTHLKKNGLLPEGVKLSDQENLKTLKKKLNLEDPVYLAFNQLINLFQAKWYGLKDCQVTDYTLALEFSTTILKDTKKSQ